MPRFGPRWLPGWLPGSLPGDLPGLVAWPASLPGRLSGPLAGWLAACLAACLEQTSVNLAMKRRAVPCLDRSQFWVNELKRYIKYGLSEHFEATHLGGLCG